MSFVIAARRGDLSGLVANLARETEEKFFLIRNPEDLQESKLDAMECEKIFFIHWSSIIPEAIYSKYECVIFHMTDLPFGRGGSPLQNLIERGIYDTKLSALRCVKGIDAGPVYLKKPLSLHGTAEEIYLRVAQLAFEMILEIEKSGLEPIEQSGTPTLFKRRQPQQSDISGLSDLTKVHDYIRMLDADGYPAAFLETKDLRFEFTRSSLRDGSIHADVKITRKT